MSTQVGAHDRRSHPLYRRGWSGSPRSALGDEASGFLKLRQVSALVVNHEFGSVVVTCGEHRVDLFLDSAMGFSDQNSLCPALAAAMTISGVEWGPGAHADNIGFLTRNISSKSV